MESTLQNAGDLICFSHLRWNFVYQRPQHLISRFAAAGRRVYFVEEPVETPGAAVLDVTPQPCGVTVVVPRIPKGRNSVPVLRRLMDKFIAKNHIRSYVLWFYNPMAVEWTRHLQPLTVIYDCMDELSGFRGAPPGISQREKDLMAWADVVFTGGTSLYETKRSQHKNVYCFPSSVDVSHFAQARAAKTDPPDQASIPSPRLGFFGVIDERIDYSLLAGAAEARPEWQFVLIGPTAKVDASELPRRSNIHYLGMKSYGELPSYISGWHVALLPFALNEATRFISPTKTPEYLAGGKPIVTTPIHDVTSQYGDCPLVHVADGVDTFVECVERALVQRPEEYLVQVDARLSLTSWSRTWGRMSEIIEDICRLKTDGNRTVADVPLRRAAYAGSPT
jgi:UDP-galactopyranose mutase